MALNFPNPMRHYDPARDWVYLWGSDASLEVAYRCTGLARMLAATKPRLRKHSINIVSRAEQDATKFMVISAKDYTKRRLKIFW